MLRLRVSRFTGDVDRASSPPLPQSLAQSTPDVIREIMRSHSSTARQLDKSRLDKPAIDLNLFRPTFIQSEQDIYR
jgi:hypothetical protein